MKTKRYLLATAFLAATATAVGGCGDRALDADWEARVLDVCESACAVSACNPLNLFYGDADACLESCTSSHLYEERDACGEAALGVGECMAALTCEEAEARSAAVAAGETVDYACADETNEKVGACVN